MAAAVGIVLPFEGPLGSEIHSWRAAIEDGCDILVYRCSRRHSISKGFPDSSADEESACSAGDLGLIPGWGRSPGEGNDKSPQYPCLENPMDRGAWGLQSMGSQRVGSTEQDFHSISKGRFVTPPREVAAWMTGLGGCPASSLDSAGDSS